MQAINIVGYKNTGKTTLLLQLAQALEAQGLSVACVKSIQKDAHTLLSPQDSSDTGRMCQANAHNTTKPRTVLTLGQDAASLIWMEKMDLGAILPLLSADILLMEGGKSCDFLPRIICLGQEQDSTDIQLKPELALATYSIGTDLEPSTLLPTQAQHCASAKAYDSNIMKDTHETRVLPHFTGEKLHIQALAMRIQKHAFLLPRLSCGACGYESCYALAKALVADKIGLRDKSGKSDKAHKPPACAVLQGTLQLQVNGKAIALNPFTQRILAGALGGIVRELKGTDSTGRMHIQCDF